MFAVSGNFSLLLKLSVMRTMTLATREMKLTGKRINVLGEFMTFYPHSDIFFDRRKSVTYVTHIKCGFRSQKRILSSAFAKAIWDILYVSANLNTIIFWWFG